MIIQEKKLKKEVTSGVDAVAWWPSVPFTIKKYSKNTIYYYQQSGHKELNDIGIQTLNNLENLLYIKLIESL